MQNGTIFLEDSSVVAIKILEIQLSNTPSTSMIF